MSTIKQTIALEDKMTPTLTKIEKEAMAQIKTFEQMSKSVDNYRKTIEAVEKSNPKIVTSDMYLSATDALYKMEDRLYKVSTGQEKFDTTLSQGTTIADGFTSKILGIVSAYAGFTGMKKLVGLSDTFVQSTARLDMMNDGLQTTEELQNMIYQAAQNSRGSYQGMMDTVAKLGMQAGDAFGNNTKQIVQFSNLLNKTFTTAGMDANSIASVMYNMTQSLSSGHLLGQDYRILKQNAPQMIKYIQDFYGVSRSELDDLVSKGKVSAQDLKNAMFSAADDINSRFDKMPMTWGQVWQSTLNTIYKLSQPLLKFINLIAQHWETLRPIVLAVAAAVGVYTLAVVAHTAAEKISVFWKKLSEAASIVKASTTLAEAAATTTATGAQLGFNMALLACPITWIVLGIILIIGVIYAVVAAINKATGSTISATGIIMGVIFTLAAFIYNRFIVPIWNAIAAFINFFANCFKDPVASIQILFIDLGKTAISVLNSIAGLMDFLFGTNFSATTSRWLDNLNATKEQIKASSSYEQVVGELQQWAYSDAWNAGYGFGEGIDKKISGALGGVGDWLNSSGLGDVVGTDNTGGSAVKTTTKDDLLSDDDIQLLLDVATRDYKLNYQQITPNITVTFGDVRETADVDNILDLMADKLEEIYDGSLEVGT